MWTKPLTIALVAAGAAVLGSLLTIFLTPWLQRHFWRKQRRDELRLETIYELKRLAAEFQHGHMDAPVTFRPSATWWKTFIMLDADIKSLFPDRVYVAFKGFEALTGPSKYGGLGPEGRQNIHDFVKARDAVIRALYSEVIPIK
jgi:hypothetical protein